MFAWIIFSYELSNTMLKNAFDLLNRHGMDYCSILKTSHDFNPHYKYISEGEQALIRMLNILSYIPEDSVLLLDEPFTMLDGNAIKILLDVMRKLQIQIILTSTEHNAEYIEGKNIYLATNWNDRCYGYPEFKYRDIFYDDMKMLMYDQK